MAATGITPTEAIPVVIGVAAIMAGATMAPDIIHTTRPSLLDCRFRFLSPSQFRNDCLGFRIQDSGTIHRGKNTFENQVQRFLILQLLNSCNS
jgi:hypothetical protein